MLVSKMFAGHIWIACIIAGYFVNIGDTLCRGVDRREGFFQAAHENFRLKYYVLSSPDVHSSLECGLGCMKEELCHSYNIQIKDNLVHKCELNSRSRAEAKAGSFVKAEGYEYYEEVHEPEYHPCDPNPCVNGGTCEQACKNSPDFHCRCPQGFTGRRCDQLENGNFLMKLSSSVITKPPRARVKMKDITTLTSCVWVKPNTFEGVVFTYATDENLMALALLFNQTHIRVIINHEEISVNIALPVGKWTLLCFIWTKHGKRLNFFVNGFQVHITENISATSVLKGVGTVIPGFRQSSRGRIDYNTTCDLVISRLYFWNFKVTNSNIFRHYNEPHVSKIINKVYLVDWRRFYRRGLLFNTTVFYPTDEPKTGDFHLTFTGQGPVIVDIPGVFSLSKFTLCLWMKSFKNPKDLPFSVFTLKSRVGVTLEFLFKTDKHCEFTLDNETVPLNDCKVYGDGTWHHLCVDWTNKPGILFLYLDGTIRGRHNIKENETLLEIYNGTVELGNDNFSGVLASVNVWSKKFTINYVELLALYPGNAEGDVFSWSMIDDALQVNETIKTVPSSLPKELEEKMNFDLVFPPLGINSVNYIALDNSFDVLNVYVFSLAFWIKIPTDASPFTLVSYATPNQVNLFNIHFGTNHLWVYVNGNKWLIPAELQKLVDNWHYFLFIWHGRTGLHICWHNGKMIGEKYGVKGILPIKQGHLVVGAQQSQYKVVSRKEHQFYGQISQMQVWKKAFHQALVLHFASRCSSIPGNIFRWSDMPTGINGTIEKRDSSDCLRVMDGDT